MGNESFAAGIKRLRSGGSDGHDFLGEGGEVEVENAWEGDNPTGGFAVGKGFAITWQDGPVNREAGETPTGAFIEDVLDVLILRLEFYQSSKYISDYNERALAHLRDARKEMADRRLERSARGVLGKNEV